MSKTKVKCKKCHQEILQSNPRMCPYCGNKEFAPVEEIAEDVMETGIVKSIVLKCPYCGEKQLISSKAEEIKCKKCLKKYEVPVKARELL